MATATEQRDDSELLHADITRPVIGILFDVFKELKYGYQEKYYQRAVALRLESVGIVFHRELSHPIFFDQRIIGRYYMDFLIQDKVVLELKVAHDFHESHRQQVLGYLKATGYQVGLLAIITPDGVHVKRMINTPSV